MSNDEINMRIKHSHNYILIIKFTVNSNYTLNSIIIQNNQKFVSFIFGT